MGEIEGEQYSFDSFLKVSVFLRSLLVMEVDFPLSVSRFFRAIVCRFCRLMLVLCLWILVGLTDFLLLGPLAELSEPLLEKEDELCSTDSSKTGLLLSCTPESGS